MSLNRKEADAVKGAIKKIFNKASRREDITGLGIGRHEKGGFAVSVYVQDKLTQKLKSEVNRAAAKALGRAPAAGEIVFRRTGVIKAR